MSQSASEHAVHFVTPPLRSGRPYENPALPELPNLWSLDHPDTAPIPDEAACRALWTRYAMFSHIERHSECGENAPSALVAAQEERVAECPGGQDHRVAPDAVARRSRRAFRFLQIKRRQFAYQFRPDQRLIPKEDDDARRRAVKA